jgi:restriction endonuclease Mrr
MTTLDRSRRLLEELVPLQRALEGSAYFDELGVDEKASALANHIQHLSRHLNKTGYPEFLTAHQTLTIFRDAVVDRLAQLRLEERKLAELDLLQYSETIHAYKRLRIALERVERHKRVSSEMLTDLAAQSATTLSSAALLAVMDRRDSPAILEMTPVTENDPRAGEVADISFAEQPEDTEKLTTILTEGIQQTGYSIDKIRRLAPRDFEALVGAALGQEGYQVHQTKTTRDGGIDLIAVSKQASGAKVVIECKRYSPANHVDVAIVRSLNGVLSRHRAHMGILVTTSVFTKDAISEAFDMYQIDLYDYRDFMQMLTDGGP